MKRVNIYEAAKRALAEGKYMKENSLSRVKVKVEERDVCTLLRLDGSHPVRGWQPTGRELLSEEWEITE